MSSRHNIQTQAMPQGTTYRVERRHNCLIVHDPIPIDDLVSLTAGMPKGALMSTKLAARLGASIVAGIPDDLDALDQSVAPVFEAETKAKYSAQGLSPEAIAWLANGERGVSSDTIFTKMTGVDTGVEIFDIPHDAWDFMRCRKLLEQCPEIASKFHKEMARDPKWEPLVKNWKRICDSLDKEAPDWRNTRRMEYPRETGKLMRKIIQKD